MAGCGNRVAAAARLEMELPMLNAIKIDPESRDIHEISLVPGRYRNIDAFACKELDTDQLAVAAKTETGDTLVVDPRSPRGTCHFFMRDVRLLISGPALLFGPRISGWFLSPAVTADELTTQTEFIDHIDNADWIAGWDGFLASPTLEPFSVKDLSVRKIVQKFHGVSPRKAYLPKVYV